MFEAEVDRGARLLDAVAPGWENRINLQSLDLNDCFRCVLGQLYGEYVNGLDAMPTIGNGMDAGVDHGFSLSLERYPDSAIRRELYPRLTRDWQAEITRRRRAAARKLKPATAPELELITV